MSGPEHYAEAERLLAMQVSVDPEDQPAVIALHLAAQAHATLALAAAAALDVIDHRTDRHAEEWLGVVL